MNCLKMNYTRAACGNNASHIRAVSARHTPSSFTGGESRIEDDLNDGAAIMAEGGPDECTQGTQGSLPGPLPGLEDCRGLPSEGGETQCSTAACSHGGGIAALPQKAGLAGALATATMPHRVPLRWEQVRITPTLNYEGSS